MKLLKSEIFRELVISNARGNWQESMKTIERLKRTIELDGDDKDILALEESKAFYGSGDATKGFSVLSDLAKSNSLQCGLAAKYLIEFQNDIESAKQLLSTDSAFSSCVMFPDTQLVNSIESVIRNLSK